MSCENETVQALKDSGHRPTPQRLMILSEIRHAKGHVSATQILDRVKKSYPFIDPSTIYRTLAVLREMRLVSETDMGAGEAMYEWIEHQKHHHLICRSCNEVILLSNSNLENLGVGLLEDYGFQADLDHFAIFGLCEDCRQTEV